MGTIDRAVDALKNISWRVATDEDYDVAAEALKDLDAGKFAELQRGLIDRDERDFVDRHVSSPRALVESLARWSQAYTAKKPATPLALRLFELKNAPLASFEAAPAAEAINLLMHEAAARAERAVVKAALISIREPDNYEILRSHLVRRGYFSRNQDKAATRQTFEAALLHRIGVTLEVCTNPTTKADLEDMVALLNR